MRIVMVTSFPPIECGVGTYAYYLAKELEGMGNSVYIICHKNGRKSKNIFPVLDPTDTNYATKVVRIVEELKPNVVHIQHEWGLFDKETYNAYLLPLLVELYAKKNSDCDNFPHPDFHGRHRAERIDV